MSSCVKTLTIAGSDSGGGAGIQAGQSSGKVLSRQLTLIIMSMADLKTFASLGTYGLSVITALTSQNTKGVDGINAPPAEFVAQQMRAVLSDIGADAIKTGQPTLSSTKETVMLSLETAGMLHNAAIVEVVASTLVELYPDASKRPPLIVDPVMVSTSGHELLEPAAETAFCERLLPLATLVTPNIPEAIILAGWKTEKKSIRSEDDMRRACEAICTRGGKNVLLKGGHISEGDTIVDVLYESEHRRFTTFKHKRIDTQNTHGTGCTLSAALTAHLARGATLAAAAQAATDYVHQAMVSSLDIGAGPGSLDHGHNIIARTLPLPTESQPFPFTDYLIRSCGDLWTTYTRTHPFITGMQDGTLPRDCFIHFLRQDYIFLMHYARIHALAAYKCDNFDDIDAATDIVKHIARESRLHIERCKEWGISEADFHSTVESHHTVAYTRYVIDIGMAQSQLHLRVATAPCLLGYGEVGRQLYSDPSTKREGNPYWPWICEYNGDDFQRAVRIGRDMLENFVRRDPLSASKLEELVDIFRKAVRLEIGFWQMGIDKS